MELLKYLPRPVGGLQGNQHCYSGKLADTQNHLELIMAYTCTSARARAHINTHQQTWVRTQTRVVCTVSIHTPRLLIHMYARNNIRCPTRGRALKSGNFMSSIWGTHKTTQSVRPGQTLAQNNPPPSHHRSLWEW